MVVEKFSYFKITAFFPHLHSEKKGGNKKKVFNYPEMFLYCLYSRMHIPVENTSMNPKYFIRMY